MKPKLFEYFEGPAGLLENTSLREFLTAVEKVRQKSEAELQVTFFLNQKLSNDYSMIMI